MKPETLLFKTPSGQSEIAKQTVLQSRPLRNVLLLVDGKRDLQSLRAMMRAISAPGDTLEQLLALGLIAAPTEPETPAAATEEPPEAFLNDDDELPSELALDTRSAAVPEDEAAAFSSLYRQMNALVSGHLGMIKAYGLQLKIEQCQMAEELLALLPEIKAALVAKHGETKAVSLLRQLGK
ncbi:MAG: hypothetical protein B7Z83_06490 [Thiomonas sp. 20-64-5]|nr:MAG: hypothetical protein B7Z83_06490 [Thiomonas sp. 20-64-5]